MKTASGHFRGIPVAPHVAAQSPADFHPAVQRSVERDPVKSRITQQLPVRATFEGVESEPFRFEFPADAVEESGGFREGERSGKILHHPGIGVHPGECGKIFILPTAQNKTVRRGGEQHGMVM